MLTISLGSITIPQRRPIHRRIQNVDWQTLTPPPPHPQDEHRKEAPSLQKVYSEEVFPASVAQMWQ